MDLNIKPVNWPEQAKKLKTSYILLAIIAGFVLGPIIGMILKGLLGLIAAIVIFVGFCAAAGPLGQRVANWRLAAMKKEAIVHASEQLQNEFLRREKALGKMRESLELLIGQANTMMSKGRENMKAYPEDADMYTKEINSIGELLTLRKAKYHEAVNAVAAFEKAVKRAIGKLDFAKLVQDTKDAAGVIADPLQEILASTSLAAAENAMNTAFSELEITLINEAPQQLLTAAPAASRIPLTIVQEEPAFAKKGT